MNKSSNLVEISEAVGRGSNKYTSLAVRIGKDIPDASPLVVFAIRDALSDMSKGIEEETAIETHAEKVKSDEDAAVYFEYFEKHNLG